MEIFIDTNLNVKWINMLDFWNNVLLIDFIQNKAAAVLFL
jgi:hypothetical protein